MKVITASSYTLCYYFLGGIVILTCTSMDKKRNTYNYILFDWDGGLANTLDLWLRSYRKTFKELAFTPTDREIIKEVFGTWTGAKKLRVNNLKKFNEKLQENFNSIRDKTKLHDGVKETLLDLKEKGKKLAIVSTSKKQDVVIPILKREKLENLFDVILGKEDVKEYKPSPEIIYKALELMNGKKEVAIIIGDSGKDVNAGKNAGIATGVFYPKENEYFYTLEEIKSWQPDYMFRDFKQLLTIMS